MNAWNTHLWNVAEDATTVVRDPAGVDQLHNRLDGALGAVGAGDEGLVVVDSLTELGTLVQPVHAYNFVKDVRADVCKGRFVPVFAGATVTSESEGFPHDLKYVVNGIMKLRLADDIAEGTLPKQLRGRKMSGVLVVSEWETYEYTAGTGIITSNLVAQMEAAEETDANTSDLPVDQTELDEVSDGSGGIDEPADADASASVENSNASSQSGPEKDSWPTPSTTSVVS